MKIQLVSHEAIGVEIATNHGGVGVSQRAVGEGLAARGHEIQVLVASNGEWQKEFNGLVIRGWRARHRRGIAILSNLRRQKRLVEEFAAGRDDAFTIIPDVAAVSWPYPLASKKVIKFTCTHLLQKYEANFDRPRLMTAIAEKIMVPRADAFFSISRRTAEVSARLFGMGWEKIPVIPNAVDTQVFRPMEGKRRNSRMVLFVGTVCEKKGALELVAAISVLSKTWPDIKLVMIGRNGVDYAGNPDFMGRIRKEFPGVCDKNVEFLGHVKNEELVQFYNTSGAVALPSRYESFGRTTIEAMACGAPVVRTNAPPAREIIREEVDGLICRTRDEHDLAEKIALLLEDPDLAAGIGARARRRVEARFSVQVVAAATERFLEDLLR